MQPRERRLGYQGAATLPSCDAGGRAGRRPWPCLAPAGIALALLAAGCSVPKEVNPVEIYRQVSGNADLDRLPPPGLDQPFPNLASVPPRPERPPLAMRESVSSGLEADRARSRVPLEPGTLVTASRPFTAAPGDPPIPAAPPPEPILAGARPIPWAEPQAPPLPAPGPVPPRSGATAPPPAGGTSGAAPLPAPGRAAPASLPPDMPLAPPPAPPADLLGPLPSAAPPPPPSPDLMAPAPRR